MTKKHIRLFAALAILWGGVTAAILSGENSDTRAREAGSIALRSAQESVNCDFNRIVIGPEQQKIAVWNDLKPNRLHNGSFGRETEIAFLKSGLKPKIYRLPGEASALNWRSDGKHLEFLLNGSNYVLLDPETAVMRLWQIDPIWTHINTKNERWDGLRKAIENISLLEELRQDKNVYSRFADAVVIAEEDKFQGSAAFIKVSNSSSKIVSIFDAPSPTIMLDAGHRILEHGLPARPIFDPSNGHIVGYQSFNGIVLPDQHLQHVNTRGRLSEDAVFNSDTLAILSASPDGSHYVSILEDREVKYEQLLCGPDNKEYESSSIAFKSGGFDIAALFHKQKDSHKNSTIAVRYHGGPFGSVEDSYPFYTTRELALRKYDILEIGGIGARNITAGAVIPRIKPEMISILNMKLMKWVALKGYSRIIIIGESFGAIGSADLALQLYRNRTPQRRVELVFLSPLTTLSLDRDMHGRKRNDGRLQKVAEDLAFGDRHKRMEFAQWLTDTISEVCQLPELTILIGSDDRLTPISQQAECIRQKTQILPGKDHHTLLKDQRVWKWLQ